MTEEKNEARKRIEELKEQLDAPTIEELLEEEFKKANLSLGKFGRIKKLYLEEHNFEKYQSLIATGEFKSYFPNIDEEADKLYLKYDEEFKEKYSRPNTDNFLEILQYETMIKSLIDELVIKEFIEEN